MEGILASIAERFSYRTYANWDEVTRDIDNGTLASGSTFLLPEGAPGNYDGRVEHRGCIGGSNLTQWQVRIEDP